MGNDLPIQQLNLDGFLERCHFIPNYIMAKDEIEAFIRTTYSSAKMRKIPFGVLLDEELDQLFFIKTEIKDYIKQSIIGEDVNNIISENRNDIIIKALEIFPKLKLKIEDMSIKDQRKLFKKKALEKLNIKEQDNSEITQHISFVSGIINKFLTRDDEILIFSPLNHKPLYIKNRYKSLDEFKEKYINENNIMSFFIDILSKFQDGDEIWHHDDFGIAPKFFERECLLLVRDNCVMEYKLLRMS
jgi:hypothetical protein